MWFDVTRVVLTSGVGNGGTGLNAFDSALRAAGISDFNLIKVTSIIPPRVPLSYLRPGAIPISGEGLMVPTIYIDLTSSDVDQDLAVAVGAGLAPPAQQAAGVIFVASCYGSREEAEAIVTEMVREGMEAKGLSRHSTEVASAHARVQEPWTTVLAAAVFCDATIETTIAADVVERPKEAPAGAA